MALPKRRHRILTIENGIHGFAAWNVESLDDIPGPLTAEDLNKVARVWNYEGEASLPTVHYFALSFLDASDPELNPLPYWVQLDGGEFAWPKWEVLNFGQLPTINPTLDDVNGVARTLDDKAYYVLADIEDNEGELTPIWKRLDNSEDFKLPIYWVIDPEGFPASLNDIEAYEEDVHRIAYNPSGGSNPHYYILERVEDDGEGGTTRNWRPLDAEPPDISGKADKRIDRLNWGGGRTVDVNSDFDKFHVSTNAALHTWTLPTTGTTDYVRSFYVMQGGAGQVRFTAAPGATVKPSRTPLQTFEQDSLVQVSLIAANTWLVTGDLQ
jgi:hypothetical protein